MALGRPAPDDCKHERGAEPSVIACGPRLSQDIEEGRGLSLGEKWPCPEI